MDIMFGILITIAIILVSTLLFWVCRCIVNEPKEAAKKITKDVKDLTDQNPPV
jgi:uncharacterized membrane-anchored protein